jgi:hypothetical protein
MNIMSIKIKNAKTEDANITQVGFHLKVLQSLLNKCNKSTWRYQISINGAFVNGSFIAKSISRMCETCISDVTQVSGNKLIQLQPI